MRKSILFSLLLLAGVASAKDYVVKSPDGRIEVTVAVGAKTTYAIAHDGNQALAPSPMAMRFDDGTVIGEAMKVTKAETKSVDQLLKPVIRQKSETIRDHYNELTLNARQYKIRFRVFDDGVAYRFITDLPRKEVKVMSEEVNYIFPADFATLFPEEKSKNSAQQRLYKPLNLSQIDTARFCSTPLIVTTDRGVRLFISESDLESYPGMFLKKSADRTLSGDFAYFPMDEEENDDRARFATKQADYMAQTTGKREYPWRMMIIADKDGKLIESNMVYNLAKPSVGDFSWVKPGKIAWDWWNALNLYGVDFKSGVNTATYKYYVDFAAKYGIEYVLLDDGWSEFLDVTKVVPDLDMEELVQYAASKNVGIMLWVAWLPFEKKMDEAFALYSQWGIKGLKVDFMDRDDQWMVDYYYRVARKGVEHKMAIDFHGSYKPTGWIRTFPNVLSSEGVAGLEQCKWSEVTQPEHNVNLPFIRMVAGPMDYTPGGMMNMHSKDFKPWFNTPATIGTRCHQLAMYVIYESPLQMLADVPTNYYREPECMEFLSAVPSVWDETRVIDGKIGDYVVIARRSGDTWYLGAMTDENDRELEVSLDFIDGSKTLTCWEDGINVKMQARDFAKRTRSVNKGDKVMLKLNGGGGYVAIIR